jgi:hypothetical protein
VAKISKPTAWFAFLALVGGVAFYFLSEPDAATKHKKSHTTSTSVKAPEGFTELDMTAKFPRFSAPFRDVFMPKVIVKKTQPLGATLEKTLTEPKKPTWALTGIFVQNGVRLALLENAVTGESQTVKAGEKWMGQPILAIKSDSVMFSNGTQMVFAEPPEEVPVATSPVLLPGAPTVPSGVTVPVAGSGTQPGVTLPPLPQADPGQQGGGNGGRGNRRQRTNRGDNSNMSPISLNLPPDVAPTQPTGNS